MVRQFRAKDGTTPVVLMGYANPVERYDIKHGGSKIESAFIRDAAQAGVDGVLDRRLPTRRMRGVRRRLRAHGMDLIFLLAPTSTDARMAQVAEVASGYVYYVSLKGVTGAGTLDVGCRRGHAAAHTQTCERARGRGFRHPRRGHGQGHRQGGRCGGHRQQDHPVDRKPAARQGGGCRTGFFDGNPYCFD